MEQTPWTCVLLATTSLVIMGLVNAQRPTEYVPLNSLTLKKLFRSNASSDVKDSSKEQSDPSWWATVENSRKNRNRYTFQPKTSTRLLNQFLDLYSTNLTQVEDAQMKEGLLHMLNFFVINNYEVDKGHVFEKTFISMSGKEPERRKEIIPPQRQSIISSFIDEILRQREVNDTSTFYPQLSKFTTKDKSSESLESINSGNQNSKIFSIKAYFTTPATLRPTIGTTSKLDLSLPSNKTHQVERTTIKAITTTTTTLAASTATKTETTTLTNSSTDSDLIPTKSLIAQESSTFARSSHPTFPTLVMLTSRPEQTKITLQELLQNPNPKPSEASPEPTPSHVGLSQGTHLLTRPVGLDFVSPFLYQKASSKHKLQYFRPINKVPSPSSPQRENITTAYLAVSPFVTTEEVPRKGSSDFSFIESPFLFHSDEYLEDPPYHTEPLESPFAVDLGPTYKQPNHDKYNLHHKKKDDDYSNHYIHADFNLHRAGSNVPDLSLAEKNFIKHRQGTPFSGGSKQAIKHPYQDNGSSHQDHRHSSPPQEQVSTTTESNDRNRLSALNSFSYKMPKFDFDSDIRNLTPVLTGRNKASNPTLVNSYVQLHRPTSRTPPTTTTPTIPPTSRSRRPTRNRASDRITSSSISSRPAIRNRIMTTTPITPFSEPKRPRLQSSLKPPSAIASLFNTGVEIRTADAQTEPLLQTISSSGPIDLPASLLLHADLNKYAVSDTSGGNRQSNRGSLSTSTNQQTMQVPRQINRQTTSTRTQNRWRDILTKEDSSEKVKLKELKELRNQNLLLLQILQNAFGEENRNASPPDLSSATGRSSKRRTSSAMFSNPPKIVPLGFGRRKEPEVDRFTILKPQELPTPDNRRRSR